MWGSGFTIVQKKRPMIMRKNDETANPCGLLNAIEGEHCRGAAQPSCPSQLPFAGFLDCHPQKGSLPDASPPFQEHAKKHQHWVSASPNVVNNKSHQNNPLMHIHLSANEEPPRTTLCAVHWCCWVWLSGSCCAELRPISNLLPKSYPKYRPKPVQFQIHPPDYWVANGRLLKNGTTIRHPARKDDAAQQIEHEKARCWCPKDTIESTTVRSDQWRP